MKKILLTLSLIFLFIFTSFSQTQECGTVASQAQIDYLTQTRNDRENWNSPEMIINLPVQHHIVRETNGTGGLDSNNIPIIMGIMNTYYANASIFFFDCGPINFIDNSNYYNFSTGNESAVCGPNDVANVINIYYFNSVNSGSGSLCGYAYFPGGPDRIIMRNSCALNGSTLTHELGHYLSLYHTHQGSNGSNPELVNGSNCTTAGDQLCDTPADPTLSTSTVSTSCVYTGSAVDPNGQLYTPDPTNIMSYSRKSCRTFLSPGQYNRSNYSAINDRGYLNCNSSIYGCTNPNAQNYNPLATIDDGSCTYCTTTLPYSENFDNGVGSWTNTGFAGNWTLNSGGTPSNSTGPTDDVTGGGNYMYIESSSPNYPSVGPFTLTSECFDLSNSINPSLSFYYNMYGAAMGTLNVYAKCSYCPNSSLIWSLSGNQGQGWNLVQIPLTSWNTLIIEFEGTTGSSWTSDIAIDDINIIGIQQVSGCTDPTAINYNPNATVDDGSCIYPLLLTVSGTNVSCNGGNDGSCTVTVVGGQASYIYLWNTGQTTQTINNLSAGTYTVTVTDAQGQSQLATIVVNEPLPLSLSYVITHESAIGASNGAIDMTVTGGTPPYSYVWNTTPNQTTEDISNLSAGDYIVYVGFNNWVCFTVDTVTVNLVIYGCTDSTAINFYSAANVDDGSCIYSTSCNSPIPTGLSVTDLTHDRAKVNWLDANTSACLVEMYRIQYREQGTTTWSTKTALGSGLCNFGLTTTSKRLWNLNPSTVYQYRVKAWYCLSSASTWSPVATFTTLDVCPNVLNFTVSTPTNTRATFTWTAPSAPYSFVRIKLRVDSVGAPWLTAGGFGVMYPALTRNKNGLTAGQSYRASSRTWCNPLGGPYKALAWSPFIFWTQPGTLIRIESESSTINNLTIYPNPSRDIFNITFISEEKQNLRVRILNVIGEQLITEDLKQFIGEYTKEIDLTEKAKGIYFLEIETEDGVINKKLILQ